MRLKKLYDIRWLAVAKCFAALVVEAATCKGILKHLSSIGVSMVIRAPGQIKYSLFY